MQWCGTCLEAGHHCEAQQGYDLCVFCEDGVECPRLKVKTLPQEKAGSVMKTCKCGCGEEIRNRPGWDFKKGHKGRAHSKAIAIPKAAIAVHESNGRAKRSPVESIDRATTAIRSAPAGIPGEYMVVDDKQIKAVLGDAIDRLRELEAELTRKLSAVQTVIELMQTRA